MLLCGADKVLEKWGVCGNPMPRSSLKECAAYLQHAAAITNVISIANDLRYYIV